MKQEATPMTREAIEASRQRDERMKALWDKVSTTDDLEMLVVDSDEDTPENRSAAETALRARGVTDVRHITAYDIIEEKVRLRSDGYVPRAAYQEPVE